MGINVREWKLRTGPLACLSPFAVMSVDIGHLLRFEFIKFFVILTVPK